MDYKHGVAWDEFDVKGKKAFIDAGNTIIEIDAEEAARWKETVAPVMDTYVKETGEKGLDGDSILKYVKGRLEDAYKGNFTSKYVK